MGVLIPNRVPPWVADDDARPRTLNTAAKIVVDSNVIAATAGPANDAVTGPVKRSARGLNSGGIVDQDGASGGVSEDAGSRGVDVCSADNIDVVASAGGQEHHSVRLGGDRRAYKRVDIDRRVNGGRNRSSECEDCGIVDTDGDPVASLVPGDQIKKIVRSNGADG
jgi:hypothetical protein